MNITQLLNLVIILWVAAVWYSPVLCEAHAEVWKEDKALRLAEYKKNKLKSKEIE